MKSGKAATGTGRNTPNGHKIVLWKPLADLHVSISKRAVKYMLRVVCEHDHGKVRTVLKNHSTEVYPNGVVVLGS